MNLKSKREGRLRRIDEDFIDELDNIKIERIKCGAEKSMISDRRITNAIVRSPEWIKIKEGIIRAKKREDDF